MSARHSGPPPQLFRDKLRGATTLELLTLPLPSIPQPTHPINQNDHLPDNFEQTHETMCRPRPNSSHNPELDFELLTQEIETYIHDQKDGFDFWLDLDQTTSSQRNSPSFDAYSISLNNNTHFPAPQNPQVQSKLFDSPNKASNTHQNEDTPHNIPNADSVDIYTNQTLSQYNSSRPQTKSPPNSPIPAPSCFPCLVLPTNLWSFASPDADKLSKLYNEPYCPYNNYIHKFGTKKDAHKNSKNNHTDHKKNPQTSHSKPNKPQLQPSHVSSQQNIKGLSLQVFPQIPINSHQHPISRSRFTPLPPPPPPSIVSRGSRDSLTNHKIINQDQTNCCSYSPQQQFWKFSQSNLTVASTTPTQIKKTLNKNAHNDHVESIQIVTPCEVLNSDEKNNQLEQSGVIRKQIGPRKDTNLSRSAPLQTGASPEPAKIVNVFANSSNSETVCDTTPGHCMVVCDGEAGQSTADKCTRIDQFENRSTICTKSQNECSNQSLLLYDNVEFLLNNHMNAFEMNSHSKDSIATTICSSTTNPNPNSNPNPNRPSHSSSSLPPLPSPSTFSRINSNSCPTTVCQSIRSHITTSICSDDLDMNDVLSIGDYNHDEMYDFYCSGSSFFA